MNTPALLGQVIAGKYEIERVLGRGGMGVVVVALHLQLGERVAIKFPIAPFDASSDLVARWVREGRTAMRIRSQHVARVFDVGTLETGEPYLVMEYLVGRDLAAVLAADGPLSVEKAVECVLQATEALAEAHAQGIIHRDLKPSNMFLTRGPDGAAITKVLDFGTAKILRLPLETPLTGPASVIGTPLFMAPEQMRSQRDVDARADIWALGATLYNLLTGKPPFSPGSLLEIHECILRGAPPLRASRPDAPEALEAALLRCMQPDPADRYANVAELARALTEVAPEHARGSALRVARILDRSPSDEGIATSTERLAFAPAASPVPVATDPSASASWPDGDAVATIGTAVMSPARLPSLPGAPTTRRRSVRSLVLLSVAAVIVGGALEAAVQTRRHVSSVSAAQHEPTPGEAEAPSSATSLAASLVSPDAPIASEARPTMDVTANEKDADAPPAASRRPRQGRESPVARGSRSAKLSDAGPSPPGRVLVRDPLADPD